MFIYLRCSIGAVYGKARIGKGREKSRQALPRVETRGTEKPTVQGTQVVELTPWGFFVSSSVPWTVGLSVPRVSTRGTYGPWGL